MLSLGLVHGARLEMDVLRLASEMCFQCFIVVGIVPDDHVIVGFRNMAHGMHLLV
jgi:hypothetical protein